jgi:hypothetical protein
MRLSAGGLDEEVQMKAIDPWPPFVSDKLQRLEAEAKQREAEAARLQERWNYLFKVNNNQIAPKAPPNHPYRSNGCPSISASVGTNSANSVTVGSTVSGSCRRRTSAPRAPARSLSAASAGSRNYPTARSSNR